MGLDPANRWVGGYVDYEFDHLKALLEAYGLDLAGARVLEFGCNVGASAIICATLGAAVSAIDISDSTIALATLNASRYGVENIRFSHVPDTTVLPFQDVSFDFVTCNSVLEYVSSHQLPDVMREIDRVLKPGGRIFVTGTSSRLWPREVHSRKWFVNYIPRALDTFLGRAKAQRGVFPWTIRYGFGRNYRNLDAEDGGTAFRRARKSMAASSKLTVTVRGMVWLASLVGIGPGLLGPNISCLLEKGPEAARSDRSP
jgi:ubiquinone/menaquinone biosynthesis C-methylase UbiE